MKSSPNYFDDIAAFMERFGLAYSGSPRHLEQELARLRQVCLSEEATEYTDAVTLADKLDALVDSAYIALGSAYLHGFDFPEAWRRVHAANMMKVRAQRPADSKRGSGFDIVKPPLWMPPNLDDLT